MRRGIYEIFTVFVFIIILVAILFFWLYLSGRLTLLKSQVGETKVRSTIAKETYALVMSCNGGQIIDDQKIGICLFDQKLIKAIKLVQIEMEDCVEKQWGGGEFEAAIRDTGVDVYTYWVSVRQSETGDVCLGQMMIAV